MSTIDLPRCTATHCTVHNQSSIAQFAETFRQFVAEHKSQFDHYVSSDSDRGNAITSVIAVDIGASNTRVTMQFLQNLAASSEQDAQQQSSLLGELAVPKLHCRNVQELIDSLNYLSACVTHVIPSYRSNASVLAAAGPVNESRDKVDLTNYEGPSKMLSAADLPAALFPRAGKTRFLNDLEACCYGIINVGASNELSKYFVSAFGKHVDKPTPTNEIALENCHYVVLAMGTGLGAGMILCKTYFSTRAASGCAIRPEYTVMPLEAGHCLVAHSVSTTQPDDFKRNEALSASIYNSEHPIEYEDICSGRGIKACYEYELRSASVQVPAGSDSADSEQIAKLVLSNLSTRDDEASPELAAARRAMTAHYSCLMQAAQNVSVMVPACKGVFFAGDNQVHNQEFFTQKQSELREEFLHHPKRQWLEEMSVFRQTSICNFNLAGALWVALHDF